MTIPETDARRCGEARALSPSRLAAIDTGPELERAVEELGRAERDGGEDLGGSAQQR